jgi:hypothetical protein
VEEGAWLSRPSGQVGRFKKWSDGLDEMKREMVSLRKEVDRRFSRVDQRFSRVDRQFWGVYGDMNTQWRWIGTIVMVIVAVLIVAVVKLLP